MGNSTEPDERRQTLDRLYRRYGGLVLRRAQRLMANEQTAHDVTQDVFVQLLRTSSTVDPQSEVAWLYRITTNCCLNLMRRGRRWRRIVRALPAEGVVTPSLSTAMLLRGVPEHLHEIAIYYGIDRMSQEEIGLVLKLSQKTISNRLRELRAYLSDEEPAEKQGAQ